MTRRAVARPLCRGRRIALRHEAAAMFASEVVLARWQAAERRLAETPKGALEADELRAMADRLCREYNEILAITVDPPPPRVVSPPPAPPTPGWT